MTTGNEGPPNNPRDDRKIEDEDALARAAQRGLPPELSDDTSLEDRKKILEGVQEDNEAATDEAEAEAERLDKTREALERQAREEAAKAYDELDDTDE